MTIETNIGQKEHLLAISNHFKSQLDLSSTVDIYIFNKTIKRFYKQHSFMEVGPFELEYFTIKRHGKIMHLLAIAGNSKVKPSVAITTRVVIYELFFQNDQFKFTEFQKFGSKSVDSIKSATRQNKTYLVLGMRLDKSAAAQLTNFPAQLLILVYNPSLNTFQFHSSIPSNVISDIEMFEVEDMLIMTVAYYEDGKGKLILQSPVYKLNDNTRIFQLYQTIETRGAHDIAYFQITNGHFIVVANEASGTSSSKTFGVPSTVYRFFEGKYHHVQNLPTYGAVRWKSATIPNCQHSVLLFYGDQSDSVDQVGFYMYSDDVRRFSKVPISFYESVDRNFRPRPKTLLPFMIDSAFYVAIGADNLTYGYSLYEVEYSTVQNESPWQKFEMDIRKMLVSLTKTLTWIEDSVSQLEVYMTKIVYKDTSQNISGIKKFSRSIKTENIDINILEISNGSIFYKENGTLYKANPNKFVFENLTILEANAVEQDKSIAAINDSIQNLIFIDEKTNVTNILHFSNVSLKSKNISAENLATSSCKINGIIICELSADIVRQNSTDVIHGVKEFVANQNIGDDLEIEGTINGLEFPDDVVTIPGDNIITANKTFESEIVFQSLNVSGKINEVDLAEESLSIIRDENVTGINTFNESVYAKEMLVGGRLDGIDIKELEKDTLSLTLDQNVTGRKKFSSKYGLSSLGNISVSGLTNGIDLDKWCRNIMTLNSSSSLKFTKKVIFEDGVDIIGNITIKGKLNDVIFPDEIVLVDKKQNITGLKVFMEEMTVKGSVKATGLVDGVNLSDVVSLSGDDVITGRKTFNASLKLLENLNVAATTYVDNVDISELQRNMLTINGSQNVSGLSTFVSFETRGPLEVQKYLDDLLVEFYVQLMRDAVLLKGDQVISGRKSFLKDIVVAENITVSGLLNGKAFPRAFLDKFSDQIITGKYVIKDLKSATNANITAEIDGIDLEQLERDLITIDTEQVVKGVKTFGGDLQVTGEIKVCCGVNNISLSSLLTKNTEQILTSKEFDSIVVTGGLEVVANNVSVTTTVDGVDLSNVTNRLMSADKDQILKNKIEFNNVVFSGSLIIDTINDVNLTEFAKDVVMLDTNQVITSEKNFSEITIGGNLVTNSTIDGIDVSSVSTDVVRVNGNHNISGKVVFDALKVENITVTGLVYDTNVTKLASEIVSRRGRHNLTGSIVVNGSLAIHKNAKIDKLNNLLVGEDIVLKNKKQTIAGVKTFEKTVKVKGDLIIDGKINGEDVSILDKVAVKKTVQQVIRGKKVFESDVRSNGNIELSDKINGVDLVELDETVLRIDR